MKVDDLLTIDQAAKLLGCEPQNLQYHCRPDKKQRAPFFQIGTHKLFEKNKLLAWHEKRLDGRTEEAREKFGWGES